MTQSSINKIREVHSGVKPQGLLAEQLGSAEFRKDYNIRYAYISGAMYKETASKELVVRMGKAGLLGFLGTGGLSLEKTEAAIQYIQRELVNGESYGMNLLHQPGVPSAEMAAVDLYLKYGVTKIEAAAYMQLTPALVKYRLKGLRRNTNGDIESNHKLLAKISRPEIAEIFLSPAPEKMVNSLLADNEITAEEAALSKEIAMADDLCTEADSGGHTDAGVAMVLIPTIVRLRDKYCGDRNYPRKIRVGAAGGIGTPEAVAAAFVLGADFVLTGSINQCTVEAGTSDQVKTMLQGINIQDTDYAPAGDMFEIGARVQVLKKGVFFPTRANKLYDLWRQHSSLEEIDDRTKKQIQEKYFHRSFEEVYAETKDYYNKVMPSEIERAEKDPKYKMSLIFRWYFIHSSRLAFAGDEKQKVDYQVHTGPALGAFNQWVKDTEMEDWRNRHVDLIAEKLMEGAAEVLNKSLTGTPRVAYESDDVSMSAQA